MALSSAGVRRARRTAMRVMTTRSSMRVNARNAGDRGSETGDRQTGPGVEGRGPRVEVDRSRRMGFSGENWAEDYCPPPERGQLRKVGTVLRAFLDGPFYEIGPGGWR